AAQAAFLGFPTAPPRKLDDRVDTMLAISRLDLDDGLVCRMHNPLAAMPSIHMAWAVISAESLRACSSSAAVRALAGSYPPAVAGIVVVTANHFLLDVLAGAAPGRAGLRLAGQPGP